VSASDCALLSGLRNSQPTSERRLTSLRFTLDTERSCVWINARSNLNPINTETRGLSGWVEATALPDGSIDQAAPVSGRLEVSADRLSSGNHLYDLELKRRIDARNHPVIIGELVRITPTADRDRHLVTGDLTFHGRTRTFEHEMFIKVRDDTEIELTGEYIFDIRQFNMKPPSMLMLKVYPEIAVRVELFGTAER
jgi:YceI-like domain